MTLRTSTLLEAVDGPTGMIRTRYGGEPWPWMLRERSRHWVGTLVKVKVYAEARVGRRTRGIEREIIIKTKATSIRTTTMIWL